MKLYLVRHGLAEERSPLVADEERPLTGKGKRRTREAFRGLARIARPERILSSPLVRAVETAEILARALGHDGFREEGSLAPGGDPHALLARLAREGGESVALVGHEPDLSELAFLLAGRIELKKAGVALIEGEPRPGEGRLAWLLPPLLLARLER